MSRWRPGIAGAALWLAACAAAPGESPAIADLPDGELSGEQLFLACAACHSLEPGEPHRIGPNLHGIMGQAAGSRAGYTYSRALRESGIVWTEGALVGFIMDSGRMLEGTWMVYHNHMSQEEVLRLAAWLAQASGQERGES